MRTLGTLAALALAGCTTASASTPSHTSEIRLTEDRACDPASGEKRAGMVLKCLELAKPAEGGAGAAEACRHTVERVVCPMPTFAVFDCAPGGACTQMTRDIPCAEAAGEAARFVCGMPRQKEPAPSDAASCGDPGAQPAP